MFDDLPEIEDHWKSESLRRFLADTHPRKVFLRTGMYKDEEGKTPLFDCVQKAGFEVLFNETGKSYLDIAGLPAFRDAATGLLLGPALAGRAATIQTPGGTAALRLFADFARTRYSPVWISDPTWGNHLGIFRAAGVGIERYPWPVTPDTALDLPALLEALSRIPEGDPVLLHGCCHNPTGVDPTPDDWREIAGALAERELFPVVDLAFLGYGAGVEPDLTGLRTLARAVPELAVACSFGKPFCLYNERVGSLTILGDRAENAVRHLKLLVRANWSNPPHHGAAVVALILEDPARRAEWEGELRKVRERISRMRRLLFAALKDHGVPGDHDHILKERSVFTRLPLSPGQAGRLRREHGVHLGDGGGMNVTALPMESLGHLCRAILATASDQPR